MLDRWQPSEISDKDRSAFLRKLAEETEYQLNLRKHLVERQRKLQAQ
jgi:hypothetical protein